MRSPGGVLRCGSRRGRAECTGGVAGARRHSWMETPAPGHPSALHVLLRVTLCRSGGEKARPGWSHQGLAALAAGAAAQPRRRGRGYGLAMRQCSTAPGGATDSIVVLDGGVLRWSSGGVPVEVEAAPSVQEWRAVVLDGVCSTAPSGATDSIVVLDGVGGCAETTGGSRGRVADGPAESTGEAADGPGAVLTRPDARPGWGQWQWL